jgi:hypothetical protein
MLPAGVIRTVDPDDEKVYGYRDDDYRDPVGGYYGPGGPGYIAW